MGRELMSWPPSTKEELEAAIAAGLLGESHFVDLKRELPVAGSNTGMAVDLAAFSVDGGVIFVGVNEGPPPTVHPNNLSGLAERIEQIGSSAVDPPVRIRSVPIETASGVGVLVVIVPPSPMAPHMVDGRYRGRGDKTNYVMGDAEVMRVRGERARHQEDVEQLMAEFAGTALRITGQPALLVIARPVTGSDELVLKCAGDDPLVWITRILLKGPLSRPLRQHWGPDFLDGLPVEHRANGWAIKREPRDGTTTLDLEIHEDGILRLRAGPLDYAVEGGRGPVNDIAINGLVKRVVLAAAAIGATCNHFGSWDFAVTVMALMNRRAESTRRRLAVEMPPYSEEVYVETITATYEEIAADPDSVVGRLLGRLNRAFGGPGAIIP